MKQWILIILTAHCLTTYTYDYDLIVIGGGDIGAQAALLAGTKNKRVALIHTNENCIESAHFGNIKYKILIETAALIGTVNRCKKAGLPVDCPLVTQQTDIMKYVETIYQNVCSMYSLETLGQHNITTFTGAVTFVDGHTLEIRGRTVTAEYILLALEGNTAVPEIEGIDTINFTTPEDFFEGELPQSIAILGEDPVGIEVAFALNALGIKVHLIEWYGVLIPHVDYEINNILSNFMKKEGINVYLGVHSVKLKSDNDDQVIIEFKNRQNKKETIITDCLFIATPPVYSPQKLALENAQVETTKQGILINKAMQTTNSSIYACGNITYETHYRCPYSLSLYQAQIAIHNMFKSFWSSTMYADYSKAEEIVQTIPPLAFAGLTEQEAYKKYGKSTQIKYYPYHQLARAHIDNATEGIAKFVCDGNGYIVGVHILGNGAQELVALVPLGVKLKNLYSSYLEKTASSSPSYLDLLWQASYLEQKKV